MGQSIADAYFANGLSPLFMPHKQKIDEAFCAKYCNDASK
jgi:hypothetical protein